MTKLLISFSLILFHLVANCQSVKLDNLTIWNNLYPNNNNFDKEKRLIRKEKKGGGESVYRTKISNIFYYKQGNQQMAVVILLSYDYTNGNKSDCHGCYPQMDVANFVLTNTTWSKKSAKYNFDAPRGSYGEAATVKFSNIGNVNALVISSSDFSFGCTYYVTAYFNVETLKKIKPDKSSKICE